MSYPEMESIVLLNKPHEAFLSVVTDLKNMGYHFLTVLLTEEENTGLSAPKVAIYELDVDNIDDRLHEQMSRVREKFPQIKFIAIYTSNLKYSMSEVYKLGFSNSFHLFFDRELFINEIFDLAPIELSTKSLNLDSLVRVNIIELEGQPLPFDLFVYLPSNKKTILYRPQGETLEDKTVEKFKKYSHYNLYIKKSDIGVYKKHCTKVLKNINANPAIPHALRNRQVAGEIKKLMAGFFTDEDLSIGEGKQLLDNASRIVEDYIKETCTDKKLLEAVEKIAGEHMTNYSHSKNVAAYCTLFGMSQGVGTPEDLHMGGLLHDIGMADLPEEMLWKSEKEMSETELSQYKLHPGNGRLELRTKKLKLSQNIIDMILQHHEKPDGSGFPYGMVANEINPLAKICAFADEFDRLTSIREGQRLYTPVEAMERISGQDGEDPADFYEVNFHSQLVDDFKNEKPFTLELPESIQPQVGETTDEDIDEGLVEASEIILPDKESKSQNIPVFETAEEVYLAKDVVEFEELLAANGEKIGFDDLKFDDDIDPITERKHQMFLKAAKEGNLELIDEFLDDGLDINIQDETGNTALMIASQSGQLETLQHLLSKGADTEILNQLNQSAIDIAAGSQQKSLFEALEQFRHQNKKVKKTAPAPTVNASEHSQKEFDVNQRNKQGQTLLMQLCAKGNLEGAEKLLNMGANVNVKDFKGHTALIFAANRGQQELVQLLLDNGAHIDMKDGSGRSALAYAIEQKNTPIVELLLKSGSRPDFRIKGLTLLMIAAYTGQMEIVQLLLAHGASVRDKDIKGKTAVEYALVSGHLKIAEMINGGPLKKSS